MATRWLAVLGHGFADAASLPLSTPVLLLGAAVLVAAAALLPPRADDAPAAAAEQPRRGTVSVLRTIVTAVLLLIVAAAALGPDDAAANPAGRLLFTVGWAGVLVASAAAGPWWRVASPLQAAAVADGPSLAGVGVWPAVAAVIAFGAVEQLADPTPLVALVVVAVYVVAGAGGAVLAGRSWLHAADPVDVASRALGALAPLGATRGRLSVRSPRAALRRAPNPPGLAAFLGAVVGLGVFDAAATHGAARPPLLFAAWVLGGAVLFVAARPTALAPALIPAAAGHLGAHYLAPLLIDTQVAVVQASDPFGLGWNLLGLTGREIVAEPIPPQAGLVLQLVVLLAGHALAMVVAGDLAAAVSGRRAAAAAAFGVRAVVLGSLLAGVYYWVGA